MCGTLADYNIVLNDWLQRHPDGNVAHELRWDIAQNGPNHNVVHSATASRKFNTVQ